ncbi:hypothetical protein P7K49_035175 [Saguinus oedipus]|uniref:Uncharacterized protein n=1 Tax=Saguinus oedipus TaxID=9490 RepID=A0ABQ9TWS9_SAGOE|nr:hypothetical protein P7K49_035175 [Saguinus oedipus]
MRAGAVPPSAPRARETGLGLPSLPAQAELQAIARAAPGPSHSPATRRTARNGAQHQRVTALDNAARAAGNSSRAAQFRLGRAEEAGRTQRSPGLGPLAPKPSDSGRDGPGAVDDPGGDTSKAVIRASDGRAPAVQLGNRLPSRLLALSTSVHTRRPRMEQTQGKVPATGRTPEVPPHKLGRAETSLPWASLARCQTPGAQTSGYCSSQRSLGWQRSPFCGTAGRKRHVMWRRVEGKPEREVVSPAS